VLWLGKGKKIFEKTGLEKFRIEENGPNFPECSPPGLRKMQGGKCGGGGKKTLGRTTSASSEAGKQKGFVGKKLEDGRQGKDWEISLKFQKGKWNGHIRSTQGWDVFLTSVV